MRFERSELQSIEITEREFKQILPTICDAEISKYPESWSPDNPLGGACVPVSLVAQRIFGGKLIRAELKDFPEFKFMRWHWANLFGDKVKDFTKPQFGRNYPKEMFFIPRTPSSILRHEEVRDRYELLFGRLLHKIKE